MKFKPSVERPYSKPNALETFVYAVVRCHASCAICLPCSDLEDEDRNSEKEDGHHIGNEPLDSVIVEYLGGEPQQISKPNGAAH